MTVNSNADNPLIGTWRLVRWDITYGDGRPERLAAFESYFQYAGPYRIQTRDGRQQVVHTVTHALNPAGNTPLTHLAFATSRFCISQSRRPALASA